MAYDDIGSIDGLEVRLPQTVEPGDRYRRNYVPVTPKSQEIPGADTAIAPESTIAIWSIDDWSAGEGDLRWRDRSRYNTSDGLSPHSDGSGLVVGPPEERTYDDGAARFTDFYQFDLTRGISPVLMAAATMDGDVYTWNNSNREWSSVRAIGGASTNVYSITSNDGTTFWVAGQGGNLYKVLSGSSTNHYAASGFRELGFFGDTLYGIDITGELFSIDQTTADTRTSEYDPGGGGASLGTPITMSDVGPVYLTTNGALHEYNEADDTGSIIGMLPGGASFRRPFWTRGTYFVPYSFMDGDEVLGAYLWYKSPVGEGSIGPLRIATTSGLGIATPYIYGVWGDRILFSITDDLWAYDMSDGAVVHLAQFSDTADGYFPYGLFAHGAVFRQATTSSTYYCNRHPLYESGIGVGTLRTGRYDFGYLGMQKILTKLTVTVEEPLGAGDSVNIAYSTDGATFTGLSGSMVEGEASKTWLTSTSATTITGVDFEFRLSLTAGDEDQTPKIVSLVTEAVGAESRLEWIVPIDVSTNNLQDGQSILEGLKALKDTPQVVELVDPWQQLPFEAPEQFDVTVEDLSTPFEQPGGKRYAVAKLRAVETIGASVVVTSVTTPATVAATVVIPAPTTVVGGLAEPATVAATVAVPTPSTGASGATSDMPVSYVSTDTTLSTQGIYIVDSSSQNITMTLPAISAVGTDGLKFTIIREGDNFVYVVAAGSDEYWDTLVQKTIYDDYGAVAIVAHDTDDEWHELGRFKTVT